MLVKAERKLAEGDTSLALDQFQNVLKRYPQNYAAITRLAEINFQLKNYSQSTQYIYLAIDIIEKFLDAHAKKTQELEQVASNQALNQLYDTEMRYKSDLGSLYHLLGLNRNRQDKLDAAIEAFRKSISLNSKATIYVDLALSQLKNDDYQSAVESLHKSIKEDSADYKAYYNLANIFNKYVHTDSAIYYYEKTTTLNDSLKWPYLYLGQLCTAKQKPRKAIDNLSRFISLDSTKVEPYFRRAILRTNLAEFELALKDWDKTIELDKSNPESFRNRGLTYFYLENYENAVSDFNRSLELKPEEPYTLINRGYSQYLLGNSEMAIKDLNTGVESLPRYPMGYYIRALTLLDLKKKKKACDDLKKALELGFNEDEVSKKLMRKCF